MSLGQVPQNAKSGKFPQGIPLETLAPVKIVNEPTGANAEAKIAKYVYVHVFGLVPHRSESLRQWQGDPPTNAPTLEINDLTPQKMWGTLIHNV